MTENEKIIANKVIESLDNIYLAAKKGADSLGSSNVNLNYLYEIIQRSKQPTKKVPELAVNHNRKYNTMISMVFSVCKNKGKGFGVSHVPLQYLKICLDTVKSDYLKAVEG